MADRIFELNLSGVDVRMCGVLVMFRALCVVSMKSISIGSVDSFGSVESVSNGDSVVLCLLCRDGNSALIFGRSIFLYFNVGRKVDGFSVDDDSVVCFVRLDADSDGLLNFKPPIKMDQKNIFNNCFNHLFLTDCYNLPIALAG